MDAKAVCFLCVLACAVLTSCAMSLPDRDSQSPDALDVAANMAHALEKILDSLKDAYDSDSVDEDDGEEVYSRRRRMIGGMHRKIGSTYKGRPRQPVFRPIFRSRGRPGPRPNYSQY